MLSFTFRWSCEALHALLARASMVIVKCVLRGDALFLIYIFFESKGHVFELPRLVQICRVGFSPARHFVCLRLDLFFDFIVKRESPAVMCAQVQMVLRFDSNGLL